MVAADRQGRNAAAMPPWAAGWNAKVFRSVMDDKPVAGISSVGNDDAHRWKDSVQSPAEIAAVDARVHCPRHAAVGREVLRHAVRPPLGSGRRRCLPTGMRRTSDSCDHDAIWRASAWSGRRKRRPPSASKTEASQLGIYQALVEARIPFEMVYEQLLDEEHLDRFKLLILPNIAALSDAQCEQLRQFVERGGSLVATFETSLYDETGKKRSDFALADLFGVSFTGKTESFVKNSYIKIEHDTKHPILRGFDDAGRMINTIGYVDVKPTATFGPAAADARAIVSRLADGRCLPAQAEDRYRRSVFARSRQRPRRLFSRRHRPHVLGSARSGPRSPDRQHRALGIERTGCRDGQRSRCARHRRMGDRTIR